MPPRKKTAVFAPELPPITATAPDLPEAMPVKTTDKPTVICHTVISDLWHPDQMRWIPTNLPVEVVLDNWLKSQIKAGLIKIVE